MVREKVHRLIRGDPHFRNEFKSQLRLLIIVTLGFTIAFTWRQTIFDAVQAGVIFFTHIESSTAASVLTSLAITFISVLFIYLASKILRENKDYS